VNIECFSLNFTLKKRESDHSINVLCVSGVTLMITLNVNDTVITGGGVYLIC
jgi:hypothetical protein